MQKVEPELETLLKPEEVAQKLQLGVSTVYHLAHRGQLPGLKIGGTLRFSPATLTKYLKELADKSYGAAA